MAKKEPFKDLADKTPTKDYDKKIKDLEDELVRKDKMIEDLKHENTMLFKTAMKNSERKVDTKLKKKVEFREGGEL